MSQIMIDDAIDDLPQERHLIVMARAMKRYNVEFEWTPEGGINVTDPDIYDLESLGENDEFIDIVADEYKRMIADDLLTGMAHKGLIEAVAIPDGELGYHLTQKGRDAYDEA